MSDVPLILTLKLDDDSQRYFNELRSLYFPPERNYLNAHLTLFHNLPAKQPQVINDIELAAAKQSLMELNVTGIKSIGNGVAFGIESSQLKQLHSYLQKLWQAGLIPQDRQKLWPHITIQNKVAPDVAMLLKEQLEQDFEPFIIQGLGLSLYEYHGGPWKFVKDFWFA